MRYPDPLNRAAFDSFIDYNPPRDLINSALEQEAFHWSQWLRDTRNALAKRQAGLGSKAARGFVRWGGIGAAIGGIVALGATPIGAPVALFGATVTIFNEYYGYREAVRVKDLDAAVDRVDDRLASVNAVISMRR
jgi:hypothetical protein